MGGTKAEVLMGTLDLLILKTLDTLGAMHGYGVARRIEQVSGHLLELNHGTVYPALLRLEQRGWISSRWGASDSNRRARYYSLTRAGKRQLAREAKDWLRMAAFIARVLDGAREA
ncbi:MAG TPA: PadR family transcriptional regulator [Candidatus Acidoferrales bacterium]|nr:PadR family transcriptional regulator [Candidatus Acidoferrales bacterium]